MCSNDTHSSDSILVDVAAAFIVGLVAIVKAAWWTTRHILAPLAAVLAVLAWRWTTAAPLLPDHQTTRPPVVTRGVRAAAHNLVTVLVVGTLLDPLATAISAIAVISAAIVTVVAVRWRAARRRRPRRVRVQLGTRVATTAARPSGTWQAITAQRGTTWTEQTVRDAGRAA
jgi:hypothetical protein